MVDIVVIGEGVVTFREILASLEKGTELRTVQGLAVPSEEGLLYSSPRPYTPLDDLPLPDRNLTAIYRQNYFSEWFKPLASMRTSLGCTARCTFCTLWGITGGKYLRRDPEAVVEELRTIAEPNVFFCDDESMCDVSRMDRMSRPDPRAGIKKSISSTAGWIPLLITRSCSPSGQGIGLTQVFVGMEDFSDQRLTAMNKGVTIAQQEKAVKILDDFGIMMYASYMVDPAYTREDFTLPACPCAASEAQYATFTVMTPLPGTALL